MLASSSRVPRVGTGTGHVWTGRIFNRTVKLLGALLAYKSPLSIKKLIRNWSFLNFDQKC